ncbi:MAG: tyrosine--tRNA ligase [Candidatus Moraniibacteriota bacterium]|nr:MAG: tyrosine--tRNA ligase [Candidatus Moranbacteria bacterium]
MDSEKQKLEKQIDELLSRGVAEVIDWEHLKLRLLSGEKLRVKLGIDPTSPNIHLGRSVSLLKLRDFQKLGHTIVFIVGDFTGQIGDTSDKESERPMLSEDDVHANMATYAEQAGKILDMSRVEIHANSTWLSRLGFSEIGKEADAFSVAEFIARDNIRKRLDAGKRVSLREMLYPLMQGHDSFEVSADVEIGGTDQRFNLLAGRRLQERMGKSPQDILTTNLILGTDGRKMSSSWGNTINLTDESKDMLGKVMSIPDELIESYFVHCTRVPMEEISALLRENNPRDTKLRLGFEIVKLYYDSEAAREAENHFVSTFSKREIPDDIHEVKLTGDMSLLDFLAQEGFATSRGDARRKIEQGGVEVDGNKITDRDFILTNFGKSLIVRCGKKDFARVVF